jgi:hypothetical protein
MLRKPMAKSFVEKEIKKVGKRREEEKSAPIIEKKTIGV